MWMGKWKYEEFQVVKKYYCKQGWQDCCKQGGKDDDDGFKKWRVARNVYHSKPVVRNHIPSKCILETITAWKLTRVLAISLFVSTFPKNIDALVTSCHQFKRILKNRALAFATICEQPFPLPHYREICGLSIAASTTWHSLYRQSSLQHHVLHALHSAGGPHLL
jgi:hypothetical protein